MKFCIFLRSGNWCVHFLNSIFISSPHSVFILFLSVVSCVATVVILARISPTVSSQEIMKARCSGLLGSIPSIRILLSTHVRVVLLVAWGLRVGVFTMLWDIVVTLLVAVLLGWLGVHRGRAGRLGRLRLVATQAAVSVIFRVAVGIRLDHSASGSISVQMGLVGFGRVGCRSLHIAAWLILGTQWVTFFIISDEAIIALFGLPTRPQMVLRFLWLVPWRLEMGGHASAHVSSCRCVAVHGVRVVAGAGRYAHGAGFIGRLVLRLFVRQAGKPCSCQRVAVVIVEWVAWSLRSRWRRRSLHVLRGCKGVGVCAVRVHTGVTVRIGCVQTRWSLLGQVGDTARIGLRVTAEMGVGWSLDSCGLVTVGCTKVVLQTLDILRITDAQQLGFLLC